VFAYVALLIMDFATQGWSVSLSCLGRNLIASPLALQHCSFIASPGEPVNSPFSFVPSPALIDVHLLFLSEMWSANDQR
jgi:hypothetical protein